MLKHTLLGGFRQLWPKCKPINQHQPLTLKVPRRSPSDQSSNRQRTAPPDGVWQCAHSPVKVREHATAGQRMGSWWNNENL